MEHAKATDLLFKDHSPELKALSKRAQQDLRDKKRADWWAENNPNDQAPKPDVAK